MQVYMILINNERHTHYQWREKKFRSTKKKMERSTPMQMERAWNGLYAAADGDGTEGIGQHPV